MPDERSKPTVPESVDMKLWPWVREGPALISGTAMVAPGARVTSTRAVQRMRNVGLRDYFHGS